MVGRKLRVAALQVTPVFLDKRATIEKYCEWIIEAGRDGVDLIVTPETGIPMYPYWRSGFGYTTPESAADWREVVVETYENSLHIPSPETDLLCRVAKEAKAHLVIGCQEQDDRPGSATLYNTMLFISRTGEILGRHRKLMPTHQERFFWGWGDASDLRVFDTDIGRIGGLICFENHMTLLKAAMAVKGEEIHAACWPGWWSYTGPGNRTRDMSGTIRPYYMSDQDAAVREYAFETQTFVISSCLYCPVQAVPDSFPYKERTNWAWAMGGSCIVNPFGVYVAEPVFNKETIVSAEIDLSDRIVAKNVVDCMGHYTRWDVVSLNVREEDHSPSYPVRTLRGLSRDRLVEIARRFELSVEKLEAIERALRAEAISLNNTGGKD